MLVKTMLNNVGNKQGLIQLSEKQNIELKNRLLEMCTDVMEFCETNGLTCVLGGGTALGAVRHRGAQCIDRPEQVLKIVGKVMI